MERISEEKANQMIEEGKKEIKRIIDEGGIVTNTIIREKDKTTVIRKIEPANGKATSSKIITAKDEVIISCY